MGEEIMTRQLHTLVQGSTEWVAFRAEHYGASEAAAMLGLSKKTSRTELLRLKSTGISKEFTDWVQKNILDKGHEVEAMARPIIEKQIGDDLYPVTVSNGKLSASCDGLTMDYSIAIEHKQWNAEYVAMVRSGVVPEEHMPQCQQVLMVTEASKLLFVISNGTEENMVFMWVTPNKNWFDRIHAGWEQFSIDLAEYKRKLAAGEIEPPKVEVIAAPVMDLP
ncbi:MAG: YqaJ viral recombinase family protein, partial [Gallionella sp.]